ncbi:MAG: DNA internalization-related competence protein ComEC/Rec2, partial [Pseudomonadota bacterium]
MLIVAIVVVVAVRVSYALRTSPGSQAASEQVIFAAVQLKDVARTSEFGASVIAEIADPGVARRVQLFVPANTLKPHWQREVCWHLRMRVEALRPAGNPGVSDRAQRLWQQGIAASATVLTSPRNRPCLRQPWLSSVRIRQRVQRSIKATMPPGDARAIVTALTTGDKQQMSVALQALLTATGVAHLMAISGLHVGLVAGVAYALIGWLVGGRAAVTSDVALIGAFVVALAYLLLAGNGVPVRRAVVMLALGIILRRARLPVSLLRVLAMTALVFVWFRPVQVSSAAFILSFSAVLSLGLAQHRLRSAPGRSATNVRVVVASQVLLTLSGLPVIAAVFGYVSIVALPANLIVVPVFSLLVIPCALVGVVLSVVWPAVAALLWHICGHIIELTLSLLLLVVQSVPPTLATTGVSPFVVAVCVALVLAGVLLRGWPARALMLLGMPMVLAPRMALPPHGCVDTQMLNVGHGTAIVLAGHDRRWLYDTGPRWRSGSDAATSIVLPFVRYQRSGHIERGVISHSDNDHDGGLASVRAAGNVRAWLGVPGTPCVAGQAWEFQGVRVSVLWPVDGALREPVSDNNGSCVLRVRTGDAALLLLGDVEAAAEHELVSLGGLAADVSTMPHHGSRTSSTQSLINAIGAHTVIASAGRRRGWLLPHPSVEDRWRSAGARVHVTARDGAIGIRLC